LLNTKQAYSAVVNTTYSQSHRFDLLCTTARAR
jgi:hypothetical protein